jgi:hypothetical protein
MMRAGGSVSYFDDLQKAALELLENADYENVALFRYDDTTPSDGIHSELKRERAHSKNIRVAFARGNTIANVEWIGTTEETDIQIGDLFSYIDDRNERQQYTVINFQPVDGHTLLDLAEVNDGNQG